MCEEKDRQEKVFKTLRTKLDQLLSIHDEKEIYDRNVGHVRKAFNNMYESAFSSPPSEIVREMNQIMKENKDLLEHDQAIASEMIEDAKYSYEKKNVDQTIILDNQKAQLSSRTNEYKDIKNELLRLEIEKKEKNVMFADLERNVKGECSLIEQQREILQQLTSTAATKARDSEIAEQYKKMQNESSKVTSEMNSLKNINAAIREKNSIISEEINTIDIQYRIKLVDKERLHFQINVNDEMLKQTEIKNQKLMNKNRSFEKQQRDEMAQLEEEIEQHRALYENLKKTITDPADQLNADIGDESQENMILQAEADLKKLNDECMTFESAINDENIEKTDNEKKLIKFQRMQAKLLNDIQSKSMNEAKPKVVVRAAPREYIFVKPPSSLLTSNTLRKRKKRSYQASSSPFIQIQNADSSISEWQITADSEVKKIQLFCFT